MIPGITNLPGRSTLRASAGALAPAAGPAYWMRPSVMTRAASARGARPLPSIRVKCCRTVVSAAIGSVAKKSRRSDRKCMRVGLYHDHQRRERPATRTGRARLRPLKWSLPMAKKIAIVEDEAELASLLEYNLSRQGYLVEILTGVKGTLKDLEAG